MKKTSTTFALLLVLGCLPATWLGAQNLQFNCGTSVVTYNDSTNNDTNLWNAAYWGDPVILSNNLADGAAPFAVQLTDDCPNGPSNYRFILYLDLNNDGTVETRVDSDSLPVAGKVHYNNLNSPINGGVIRSFDFRFVPPSKAYQFEIGVDTLSPGVRRLHIQWRSGDTLMPIQLPYGKHRVQWLAYNDCGNSAECTMEAQVKDGAPPVIACVPNATVTITYVSQGMLLSPIDFITSVQDNYVSSSQMPTAIRVLEMYDNYGFGTGWPRDYDGSTQDSYTIYCNIGLNTVEVWASDGTQMAACTTQLLVQDIAGCDGNTSRLGGKVTTEEGVGIQDMLVLFRPLFPLYNYVDYRQTLESGYFLMTNFFGPATVSIKPELDIDPLNGVNTYDLVLISRNILGLEPLNSPYKLIAADANRSGTVTTFDIVELRKLILGSYQKLPNNTSWRFVDKKQVFPIPQNPFSEAIQDSIIVEEAYSKFKYDHDFIGIKVGDVDLTATTDFTSEPVASRLQPTVYLTVKDQYLPAGEVVTVHFQTPDDLAACQLALDLGALELVEIIPENGLTDAHFAHFSDASENTLAVASELPNAAFSLRVRAPQAGYASEFLGLNTARTPATGFDHNGAPAPLALRMLANEQQPAFLFQNAPNPWTESTQIGFYLPHSGPTSLRVFNATGQLVHEHHQISPEGYNSHTIQKNELSLPGLYWYALHYNNQSFARKMMIR